MDVFWSREPGTIEETLRECRKILWVSKTLGLESVLPAMGPSPLKIQKGWELRCASCSGR